MGGREAGNGSEGAIRATRRKNTIQHLRSPDLIMISWSPLSLWTTAASPKSQLNIQACICPPLLGLTPPTSHFPSLSSPTGFPYVGWMPLCSLLFSFFMAEFFSIFHKYSVCVNSMICLLKITDIDRALHSLQTTLSSIISNESPTILWEGGTQGSSYGHIFYRQENWGLGRRSSDLPNVT